MNKGSCKCSVHGDLIVPNAWTIRLIPTETGITKMNNSTIIGTFGMDSKDKAKSEQTHTVSWNTGGVEWFMKHKNIAKDFLAVLEEHSG